MALFEWELKLLPLHVLWMDRVFDMEYIIVKRVGQFRVLLVVCMYLNVNDSFYKSAVFLVEILNVNINGIRLLFEREFNKNSKE